MAKKLIAARVLCDIAHLGLKCGQLVQAEEKVIKPLADDGQVDAHKDAVAYAKEQGAEVVTLEDAPAAEPVEAPAPEAPAAE